MMSTPKSATLLCVMLSLSTNLMAVDGFGVAVPRTPTFSSATRLSMSSSVTPTDLKSAMEAAMAASKEHGSTSPEARSAWELVEELQFGADNSEATRGGLDVECSVDDVDGACKEYDQKMQEFKTILGSYQDQFSKLKTLTTDLSNLKLGVNTAVSQSVDSPELKEQLKQAVASAKQATEQYGLDSSEAKLAWEAVEELASSSLSAATLPSLDKECLVEQANDACLALEELSKALEQYEKTQA